MQWCESSCVCYVLICFSNSRTKHKSLDFNWISWEIQEKYRNQTVHCCEKEDDSGHVRNDVQRTSRVKNYGSYTCNVTTESRQLCSTFLLATKRPKRKPNGKGGVYVFFLFLWDLEKNATSLIEIHTCKSNILYLRDIRSVFQSWVWNTHRINNFRTKIPPVHLRSPFHIKISITYIQRYLDLQSLWTSICIILLSMEMKFCWTVKDFK